MGGIATGIGLTTEDMVWGGSATREANTLTAEVGGELTELCVGAAVVAEAEKVVDLFVGRGEDFVVDDRPACVGGFPAVRAGAAATARLEEPEDGGETELHLSD